MTCRNFLRLSILDVDLKSTHLLSSSWLCANAWATLSNLIDLAVKGDAPPPLLLSPKCISSLDNSDDNGASWSCQIIQNYLEVYQNKVLLTCSERVRQIKSVYACDVC